MQQHEAQPQGWKDVTEIATVDLKDCKVGLGLAEAIALIMFCITASITWFTVPFEERDLIISITCCWRALAIRLLEDLICRELKSCLTQELVECKLMTNISSCNFKQSFQNKYFNEIMSIVLFVWYKKFYMHILKFTEQFVFCVSIGIQEAEEKKKFLSVHLKNFPLSHKWL